MRKLGALLGATAFTFTFAATSPAAEVLGTIVSNDPSGRSVVIRTDDGRTVTVRTDETTRIEQGDAVVATTTLVHGVPVRVVTSDAVAGGTVVAPLATRILVAPSDPDAVMEEDDTDVDIDTDDDDDDVDIDTDDDD
jgi:hypothetical protein